MIPRLIHYFWFGNKEIPEINKKYIEGWRKICPNYEVVCWNENNYDIHSCRYMEEAYSLKKLAFVSDYARIDILYKYGGFYFDTDVELIKPLDAFLNEHCVMGFERNDSVNLGHGFGTEKNNPFLKELLDFYNGIKFINDDNSLNITTLPVYVTNKLLSHGLITDGKEQLINSIHIYPTDYFCPKDFFTDEIKITTNTIAIHHFEASWYTPLQRNIHNIRKREMIRHGVKKGKIIANRKIKLLVFFDKIKARGIKGIIDYFKKTLSK